MTVEQRLELAIGKCSKNVSSFANEIQISHTAIGRILKKQSLPSAKILIPLGEKFGVSIDWVLFGVGEMFIDPSKADKKNRQLHAQKALESKEEVKGEKKEIEYLKQKLKEKDLLIAEKTKLLEAKDKIIDLLEKKKL
ncbi:transcriptional regulator [Aureispira sp. CCB-QB1]|uniref:helix-turn-helix domain-containing protein n=1 Tax=Aureispira sp. CCB-QB1 TaxID=1313421 RepID=UPI000697E105|nr:transcriptional regulator [Aureispira sp. CCB-QB1]